MNDHDEFRVEAGLYEPVSVTRGDARAHQRHQRALRRAKRRRDAFLAVSVADPWLMTERAARLARLYVQGDRLARDLAPVIDNLCPPTEEARL